MHLKHQSRENMFQEHGQHKTWTMSRDQCAMWNNKWMQNAAVADEEWLTIDLVKTVTRNIEKDDAGLLNTYFKVARENLTDGRLKTSQCSLDGGSAIIEIVEIEKKRKVTLSLNTCMWKLNRAWKQLRIAMVRSWC